MRRIAEMEDMKREVIKARRNTRVEEDRMYYLGIIVALDWVRNKRGEQTQILLT